MPASNALRSFVPPKAPMATVLSLGVVSLALAFVTARSSFDQGGKPTCDRRVLNTYLYVFTVAAFLALFAALFLPFVSVHWGWFIAAVLVDLIAFLFVLLLPSKHVAAKHGALAVLILASGFLYATLIAYTESSVLVYALLITLGIFGLLTLFAYKFEHLLLRSHYMVVSAITIVAIFAYIVTSFFLPPTSDVILWLAGLIVLLVTASVAYKAKEIKEKECSETAPPDYPRDAVSILVDLRVIFNLLTQILSGRRGGRR